MDKNVGWLDRIARIVIGAVALGLVFTGPHTWWGLIGMLPLVSAFRGNCPIYSVAGLSTRREQPSNTDGRLLGL